LHFHRFQHHKQLPGLDNLARGNLYADCDARDGRGQVIAGGRLDFTSLAAVTAFTFCNRMLPGCVVRILSVALRSDINLGLARNTVQQFFCRVPRQSKE
jgi:hypothetical protein